MFYLNEVFLRLKYIFLSFIFTLICLATYKDLLIPLISFSLLNTSEKFGTFIYTNPTELLKVQLYAVLVFSIFLLIPFLSWNFLEFFKSSLFKSEYKKITKILISFLLFFYCSNFIVNFTLFPKIWCFFENFNFSDNSFGFLSFSSELKIEEYLSFFIDFTSIVNSFLFLFLTLLFLILKFGVSNLLKWKKLFILLNIVFATLLSPPDVYSQLTILIFLTLILEINIIIFLLITKINKNFFQSYLVR
jgi:sec-independent protein translocase protein TatC